jgi:hypothetical protein
MFPVMMRNHMLVIVATIPKAAVQRNNTKGRLRAIEIVASLRRAVDVNPLMDRVDP